MPALHITIADLNSHHEPTLNSHPDRQISIHVKVSDMVNYHQSICISITKITIVLIYLLTSPHSSLIKVITSLLLSRSNIRSQTQQHNRYMYLKSIRSGQFNQYLFLKTGSSNYSQGQSKSCPTLLTRILNN